MTACVLFFFEVLIYLSQMAETVFTMNYPDLTNAGKRKGWMSNPSIIKMK